MTKKVLIKGIGASQGVVIGYVRIAFDPSQVIEKFKEDDILVTSMTDPNWTICMRKAKAIITNSGGVLSHAAIVARELGIPCIVGTTNATEKLKDGIKIIVDGLKGLVYEYDTEKQ